MTHLIIQTATNGALSAAALVEESNKCFFCARALISLGVLSAPREELDGRIGRYSIASGNLLVRLCIRINVGNNTLRKEC